MLSPALIKLQVFPLSLLFWVYISHFFFSYFHIFSYLSLAPFFSSYLYLFFYVTLYIHLSLAYLAHTGARQRGELPPSSDFEASRRLFQKGSVRGI